LPRIVRSSWFFPEEEDKGPGMTEVARKQSGVSWLAAILAAWHDPAARRLNVDLLAVLVAILLPWSTSAVAIGLVLWIIALVPTVNVRAFARSQMRPICSLPIAFFLLAAIGMLWSDAPWAERLHALGPVAKLLLLPSLFYHFERSSRGMWVFIGFLASCMLLMAVSWLVLFYPHLSLRTNLWAGAYDPTHGVFVKNYIDQSQEFTLCAVALAFPILTLLRTRRIWLAALLAAIALGFVANMMFVIVSRTALVTMPIMLAVFAVFHLKWRTSVMIFCAAMVLAALAWTTSPQLRGTAGTFVRDYRLYKEQNQPTSIGLRLEFWQKSLRFFAEAPIAGHGTGSTRGLFEQAATGPAILADGQVIDNPHNQTLNVAVQWGVIGIAVLYAMWLVHLLLFRGGGLVNWLGLLVVVQNVFTSLFNSHLFDFHEGWMYVLGVGVAGGMTLAARRNESDASIGAPANNS
jgi:O-antigen ligase